MASPCSESVMGPQSAFKMSSLTVLPNWLCKARTAAGERKVGEAAKKSRPEGYMRFGTTGSTVLWKQIAQGKRRGGSNRNPRVSLENLRYSSGDNNWSLTRGGGNLPSSRFVSSAT